MRLWASLYAMVWIVFLEIWLGFTPIAPPVPYYAHILLGGVIVALAYTNFRALRRLTVPGRIKRIAKAITSLSVLMVVLGALLVFDVGSTWSLGFGLTIESGLRFLHFVNAMAIVTQASAIAIAYDMWEDREFLTETRPDEVPAAIPAPAGPIGGA